jgi:glycosyltransferase involved in cell wall biosynthesis
LSPCGGAERLTLVTMYALSQEGLRFDFTTCVQPDVGKLENAYGSKIASVIKKAEKINILDSLEDNVIEGIIKEGNYGISINTHGDVLPFYHNSFSKNNAITYCHFPSAKLHIDSENLEYLRDVRVANFPPIALIDYSKNNESSNLNLQIKRKIKDYFKFLGERYESMMKNTLVITNSKYSSKAIYNAFNIHPKILYPPVDVETFRDAALLKSTTVPREDIILVISRIAPDKQIENAIELAKIIKDRGIRRTKVKGMVIVGNLYEYDEQYYQKLKKMIADYDLLDYISLQTNVCFNKLIQLMQLAKVYFHPRIDEHFGISIVEAMASGLVPIVSDAGGHTEFVPSKYQFHTLDHAADLIALAFEAPTDSERRVISDSTIKFSNANYVKSFHYLLSELRNNKNIN